jgi:GR25 family glycosyltransferase involved in LPS biosynthesis
MKTVDLHLSDIGLSHYERVSASMCGTRDENISEFSLNMCMPGALGCSASHRKIWKEVIDQNLDMAMILEDDVRFVDGAMEELDKALSELPDDFDILYVGSSGLNSYRIRNIGDLFLYPISLLTGRRGEKISDRLVSPLFPLDMHAYVISNKGAKKLFERQQLSCHQDLEIAIFMGDIETYACEPVLATQAIDKFESSRHSKFPYVVSKFFNNPAFSSTSYDILHTFPISLWTLIVGVLSVFQPALLLVIIPDVYYNFNMVISTLLINLVVRVILSRL